MSKTKTLHSYAQFHVVPLNDLREHTTSTECWCQPIEDYECPGVWVHHAMDEREQYEKGRKTS